ncbi:hypothetical protein LTS07_008474 [Exophiala sideris]|uniref:Major facilitator superfamily (MFS) profile domain-containing protein n=1 Tax=Exophiala sideris TaxID=1016849 RepID=A0ABR0J1K6_9EURO|nr:hypothetical protein LTS07_008474 [Exophiala sideris]KAK5030721.1 hypothetical protein LTR13_008075 [Exophiala sideris]KAK5054261.1 hypothetical protein LTR69_008876 [Exophiala sideris]KAK5179663.1 hypothetical protein LTR44_007831 [Eurotiomycetes sp. CCFEE 6388]
MAGDANVVDRPSELETQPPPKAKKVSYLSLPHKGQLAILCLARMADPLAQTSIQSYMFYQLKFFDPSLSDAAISAQAGFLISAKTAAQVCSGMLWGRLADSEHGGRKLVLLIGLASCCVSYLGYGLARSFVAATIFQVLGGSLSSNVALTRCVVAELNPEKAYRARALLLLPLFANAGNLLGPLIGGLLSSNARDAPSQGRYPYLAPNLCVAAVYMIAALGVLFGLNETLESLQHSNEAGLHRTIRRIKSFFSKESTGNYEYAAVRDNDIEVADSPTSTTESSPAIPKPPKRKRKLPFRRIWTFNVVCTMLSHFVIAGHLGTFSSLWAIFLSTPVGDAESRQPPFVFNGGLGMLPRDVGFAMALLGAIGVLLQLVVYPLLQDRFGTIRIWRCALLVFPIVYILAPFPSLVASAPSQRGDTTSVLVWLATAGVIVLFIVGRTGVTPATTLLINDCTPHPSVRGTIHTTGTVVGNLARSFFPIGALAIFGQGLRIGVVGLGFWCLMALAILSYVASLWVTEGSNGLEINLDDEDDSEEE